MNEVMSEKQKTKPCQKGLIAIVITSVVGVSAYCFHEAYSVQTAKVERHAVKNNIVKRESDGTWGVLPADACGALQNIGLVGINYAKNDANSNIYSCQSQAIQIPSTKGEKTVQYAASGFPEKATHFNLKLRIDGNPNDAENIAARKSWAVYSAVILNQLFPELNFIMSDVKMEELASLTAGKKVDYYIDSKLRVTADVVVDKKNGIGIYSFNIDGLPNLSVN